MEKCTYEDCICYTKNRKYANHCRALKDIDFGKRVCPFYKVKKQKVKGVQICVRGDCLMYDEVEFDNHCSGLHDIDFGTRPCPFYKQHGDHRKAAREEDSGS